MPLEALLKVIPPDDLWENLPPETRAALVRRIREEAKQQEAPPASGSEDSPR